jgi:hypothetical protein
MIAGSDRPGYSEAQQYEIVHRRRQRGSLMPVFRFCIAMIALVFLTAPLWAAAADTAPADLVIDGGKIYTVDHAHSTVEALAVRDGNIVFTGSSNEAKEWIGPKTKIEHLAGRLVLPGLFDSHIHPLGIVPIKVCDLDSKEKTLRELSAFVHACAGQFKVPADGWLSVHQWNFSDGNQPDAGQSVNVGRDSASRQRRAPRSIQQRGAGPSQESQRQCGRLIEDDPCRRFRRIFQIHRYRRGRQSKRRRERGCS